MFTDWFLNFTLYFNLMLDISSCQFLCRRKYLRDAEKRYYALLSHQRTLDVVELQISDMKTETDSEKRLQFLQTVYKIWEHGVHKLAKEQDRTNMLLAEAYRVVLRKLEVHCCIVIP